MSGSTIPSDAQITSSLATYGVRPEAELCNRIRNYISLLLAWNRKVSLTTVTEVGEILRFHFGESSFAASAAVIRNGRLADVGSGAGFPGLPLAMLSPALRVVLIESSAKKAAFLAEAIRTAQIANAEVLRSRMEEIGPEIGELDFVAARALGRQETLLKWASRLLRPNGKAVLWLGQVDAEALSKMPGWLWRPPIRIPDSRKRFLLIGSPRA